MPQKTFTKTQKTLLKMGQKAGVSKANLKALGSVMATPKAPNIPGVSGGRGGAINPKLGLARLKRFQLLT